MKTFIPFLLSCFCLLAASSCQPTSPSKAETQPGVQPQLTVLATTTMISDLVQSIGDEDIQVIALMGPGVDPHLYKPSASDARTMREADVVFYNGLMLEGRLQELFEQVRRDGGTVHELAASVPENKRLQADEQHADPHIWFDPELWIGCIEVVSRALQEADPSHAASYQQRADALKDHYQTLLKRCKELVSQIPAEQRVLITSHDAFNYFGRAFGFEVIGVQGISTSSEAGLADVAKMVDLIKQRHIKSIFVESSVSPAAIERISRDSGAKIGGELFSDALGTPGDTFEFEGSTYDKGTYAGALLFNIITIVNALK